MHKIGRHNTDHETRIARIAIGMHIPSKRKTTFWQIITYSSINEHLLAYTELKMTCKKAR
jgi:hypothetical protein